MNLFLFATKRFISSKRKSKLISSVSSITIGGIAIGITVVILALTILDGFEKVISDKISTFSSQIKITGFGNRNLPNPDFISENISSVFRNKIKSAQPFTSKLAIIKSKNISDGLNLSGVKPDYINSNFRSFLLEGSSIKLNSNSIYLGKILAQKLNCKIGDKITIFSLRNNQPPSLDNPPAIEQFFVSGIFETGVADYDDGNGFIDYAFSQKLFGMLNECSGFNLQLAKEINPNNIAEELQEFLGYPFYVRTIYQVHQNIFTWIELQKKPIPLILGLIIIVALFNIIGTLLMIVLEKTNTIGILRALGLKRRNILLIFWANSSYLIFWGLVIGNSLSLILSIIQQKFNLISLPAKVYFVTSVPIAIEFKNYLFVSLITIIVAYISALLPSFIATKIKPITALKFD